jgi:hypothetical protein
VLSVFGLLPSLEISSLTPGALCPPVEEVRQVIEERVGEVDAEVRVSYGVVRQGLGKGMAIRVAISTDERCGPVLNRDYPIESGSCEEAKELLATVVEGFVTDPPSAPAECSEKLWSLHASADVATDLGADVATDPGYGVSLGLQRRHSSGLFLGAWGTLLGAPEVSRLDPLYERKSLKFWSLSGRLIAVGGYTLALSDKVGTDLSAGFGPGFQAGQLRTGPDEPIFSRVVLVAEAQNRWRYWMSSSWAFELAIRGHFRFYPEPLTVGRTEETPKEGANGNVVDPIPDVQASLSLGVAHRF